MEEQLQTMGQIRTLYSEMLKISEQQLNLLQQKAPIDEIIPNLIMLIEQRQKIMDNIDTLSLAVKLDEQETEKGSLEPVPQDSALLAVYHATRAANIECLKAIQENDKKIRPLAQALLRQASVSLGNARKNIQALKSYAGGPAQVESWFFDRHK